MTTGLEDDLRRITYDYCIESDWIEDDENDKRLPLERRLQAMVGQLKAQASKNGELRAALLRLRDEREELRARVSRLEETCTGQQIRISDLSSYLSDAEKERDELRAEVERLRAGSDKIFQAYHEAASERDKFRLKLLDAIMKIQPVEDERDQLRDELERVRIPDGWAVLPLKPTEEMEVAVDHREVNAYSVWQEMARAAPSSGQQS